MGLQVYLQAWGEDEERVRRKKKAHPESLLSLSLTHFTPNTCFHNFFFKKVGRIHTLYFFVRRVNETKRVCAM